MSQDRTTGRSVLTRWLVFALLLSASVGIAAPPSRNKLDRLLAEYANLSTRYSADLRALADFCEQNGFAADAARLDHIAATLDIAHLMDRRVRDLSGGERQRVAMARALVSSPRILLLDEPLTGVDRGRKDRILPYLLRIRRELHVPLVYVTHDARELGEIADRVLRMEAGRVMDAGAPDAVLALR